MDWSCVDLHITVGETLLGHVAKLAHIVRLTNTVSLTEAKESFFVAQLGDNLPSTADEHHQPMRMVSRREY
jgi:hypothetical protein